VKNVTVDGGTNTRHGKATMTTIACNRESIACDLQVTAGNTKFKATTKIWSFDPTPSTYHTPYFVGYAGHVQKALGVLEWLANPVGKAPTVKQMDFLVLTEDGKIFTFQSPVNWIEVNEPFYCIGSGADFASGALASGKTPLEAVKVASHHDINTGMGFRDYNF
jgi:ATP-dependent protease HslVU (ClpYQ) peptidase subunit